MAPLTNNSNFAPGWSSHNHLSGPWFALMYSTPEKTSSSLDHGKVATLTFCS